HDFFDELGRFGCGFWRCFAGFAAIDLAHMTDNLNALRDNFQLLAGFFTDNVLLATALAMLLMFWQLVDNFNTWQLGRKRFTLATGWLGFGLLSSNRGCCFRQNRLMLSIDLLLFIR